MKIRFLAFAAMSLAAFVLLPLPATASCGTCFPDGVCVIPEEGGWNRGVCAYPPPKSLQSPWPPLLMSEIGWGPPAPPYVDFHAKTWPLASSIIEWSPIPNYPIVLAVSEKKFMLAGKKNSESVSAITEEPRPVPLPLPF